MRWPGHLRNRYVYPIRTSLRPLAPSSFSYGKITQLQTVNELLTRFKAFDTSNKPSSEAEAEYRPDVTNYEQKPGSPKEAMTSFQKMEMFIVRGQLVLYATRQQSYQFRTSIICRDLWKCCSPLLLGPHRLFGYHPNQLFFE